MALTFLDGEINYKISGEGQAIVFLHGFMESLKIWKKFEEFFSESFKVITIDLPGHGKSSNFFDTHSMDFMAEAVEAVLNHEKIEKAFFVGHSMGGYVSLSMAEKYPSLVRAICLFSSTAFEDTEERKIERQRAVKAADAHKMKFITSVVPNLFYNRSGRKSGKRIYRLVKIAARQSKDGITAAIRGMMERKDKTAILKKAKFPILLIGGHDDYLIPTERIEEMSQMIKKVHVVIIEQCGHVGFYEAKKESIEAIHQFAIEHSLN
jgi:pimeloyl-ACP methyl ester carboxylesterase